MKSLSSWLSVVLLVLLALLATNSPARAEEEDLLSKRLAGTWRPLPGDWLTRFTLVDEVKSRAVTIAYESDSHFELPAEGLPDIEILRAGKLTLGSRRADVLVGRQRGSSVLLIFPEGMAASREPALTMHFRFVPAVHPAEDVLFLGGADATEPYFPHERELVAKELTSETRALLRRSLMAKGVGSSEVMRLLPTRPDWLAATEYLWMGIRTMPPERLNNSCLALRFLIGQHLESLTTETLDTGALLRTLSSHQWNVQSKCASVVAAAAQRPELLGEAKKRLEQALIQLTASQRSQVTQAALTALQRLTGKDYGRNPRVWQEWYRTTYSEQIDLAAQVYELVGVARVPQQGAWAVFNDQELQTSEQFLGALREFANRARSQAQTPSLVIYSKVLPQAGDEKLSPRVAEILRLAQQSGYEDISLAKPDVEIFPPFKP